MESEIINKFISYQAPSFFAQELIKSISLYSNDSNYCITNLLALIDSLHSLIKLTKIPPGKIIEDTIRGLINSWPSLPIIVLSN